MNFTANFCFLLELALIILVIIFLYFLPTIIATKKKHNKYIPITILNFFVGWTIIGWLVLLIWAVIDD